MLSTRQLECVFCREASEPEDLYGVRVPFLKADRVELCAACRDWFQRGGRTLEPFEPAFRPRRTYQWLEPTGQDALLLLEQIGHTPVEPAAESADGGERRRWWQFWRGGITGSESPAGVAGRARAEVTPTALAASLKTQAREALNASRERLRDRSLASERDLATALAAAVLCDEELVPVAELQPMIRRLSVADATDALVAIYAHHRARRRATALQDHPCVRAAMGHPRVAPRLPQIGGLWMSVEALAAEAHALDPELWALMELARRAYTLYLPYTPTTALHVRVGALNACLILERGDWRPKGDDGRSEARGELARDRAERVLRALAEAGEADPALRDPRVPLLRSYLDRIDGDVTGMDVELATGLSWVGEGDEEIELALRLDTYVRAVEADRWNEATRTAILRCNRLAPNERGLALELAHTYLRLSRPEVAREVLEAPNEAALARAVADSLGEARPFLEDAWRAQPDDAEGRLLFATCLTRLQEHDEAWRVIRGGELLELVEAGEVPQEARAAELLHVAGLLAEARGKRTAALALLLVGCDREADPARRRACRRNLLTLVQAEVQERVDDLAERTAGLEPEERDVALVEGLGDLLAFLTSFSSPLTEELGLLERDRLAWFLGRELLEEFSAQAGFGPDMLDTARFSSAMANLHQAYRALALRRLPDAARLAQRAHQAGTAPLPLRLLLSLLDLIRSGGEGVRLWALAQLERRVLPADLGVIRVGADALKRNDLAGIERLFAKERGPRDLLPPVPKLQGRFTLRFDAKDPARDPAARAYVKRLVEAYPALPFLLRARPSDGQFRLVFGAFAPLELIHDTAPGVDIEHPAVVAAVKVSVAAVRALCAEHGMDPLRVLRRVFPVYSPERLADL